MNLAWMVAVISLVAAIGNGVACVLIVPQIPLFHQGSDNNDPG